MTSVNAIRFDRHRGAILVDETISAGGNLAFHGSDKVRPCVPAAVQEAFGTVAGLAGTGTCSFTDTVKCDFADWLSSEWKVACEKAGGRPAGFLSLDRMAEGLFEIVVRVKNQRLSERIRGDFGFDLAEFIEGRFERRGKTEEIRDRDVDTRLMEWLSFKGQPPEVKSIFLNALLLAGYEESTGFQIYHVDLRDGYWHRVQTCYMAEGSGRFSVDPTMYPFVERLRIDERRGDVDPVEGLVFMLAALNSASEHEMGVGGYPTVLLFDGGKPHAERQWEVSDDRAFLAARAVKAWSHGYLAGGVCHELVEGIFFGDLGLDPGWELLWSKVEDRRSVSRLLRGYKVPPRGEPLARR